MKKSKIVWEGFSWFVVGLAVDIGLLILSTPLILFPDVQWPGYVLVALIVITPFALPIRAVVREIKRQKKLGIDRIPSLIRDPVLGKLVHEGDEWNGKVGFGSAAVELTIYGEGLPDSVLLQRARTLVQEADQFLVRLAGFKEAELTAEPRLAPWAEEIRGLTVFSITFYDPPEPERAFIVYHGSNDETRSWHSDLEAGNPVGLSFDT